MLIDNKTKKDNTPLTVYQFFKENIGKGNFDIVSGYFSVGMLADFQENFAHIKRFRLILGNLTEGEKTRKAQIDLLCDKPTIIQVLSLKQSAQKAISFLEQENVHIRTYENKFCHAKAYIYKNEGKQNDSFFSVGSSNLTHAGLTDRASSNIELNYARTGQDADFESISQWYEGVWKDSQENITIDKKNHNYRNYIIGLIKKLYREYTPKEIYYKILFELFYPKLLEYEQEMDKKLEHLKDSVIWSRLFDFQKQGVLSLLRMLQQHNGAILADAVGLGKTWQALAVIKFYELEGYRTVLLCPKKLANNWERYQANNGSIFEMDDFRYVVRFHTDLQEKRLEKDDYKTIQRFFQNNQKILFVIDESHNLRNDKSERYKFLVKELLSLEHSNNKSLKVLLLSATPINTAFTDIRNQFKLLARGENTGFSQSLDIKSLDILFGQLQKEFNAWQKKGTQNVKTLLEKVPQHFFSLTDALVVARTRQMIEKSLTEKDSQEQEKLRESLRFPKKQKPINRFHLPKNFGELDSSEKVIKALEKLNFIAYRPAEYIKSKEEWKKDGVLKNEANRQNFLARMMLFLLIKRLESSWHSFHETLKNILEHHQEVLQKVEDFIQKKDNCTQNLAIFGKNTQEQFNEMGQDLSQYTLGKKEIPLKDLQDIDKFRDDLVQEIKNLKYLSDNMAIFAKSLETDTQKDDKLLDLVAQITHKRQATKNPKVLIFTVFKDTAFYLFDALQKIFPTEGIGVVSGDESKTNDGFSSKKFEPILEQFAPYTKLFKEGNWIEDYLRSTQPQKYFSLEQMEQERKKVSFEQWKNFIENNPTYTYQRDKLQKPIDILVATDCLSEGQNLQDCDGVINYDIHWNPVRIIQRLGRIDRIGSPNESIIGINFWIGKDYEDTINLKNRVEKRMAAMSLVGTEVVDKLTDNFTDIMHDNPMLSLQEQKMLKQMQFTWDDIEVSDKNLSLADFSLEIFREELREFLMANRKFLEEMPNGVFSGFGLSGFENHDFKDKNIVALIRHKTDLKLYLLLADQTGKLVFLNQMQCLTFLRNYKNANRKVDQKIDIGESDVLEEYSDMLKKSLIWKGSEERSEDLRKSAKFGFGATNFLGKKQENAQEYFVSTNFELIVWQTITK